MQLAFFLECEEHNTLITSMTSLLAIEIEVDVDIAMVNS